MDPRVPDETRLTARLPNLEIEVVRRDSPDGNAEIIAVQLRATPGFDALRGLLAPALMNPLLLAGPLAGKSAPGRGGPGYGGVGASFPANPFQSNPMLDAWMTPMRVWSELAQRMWAPWLGK